MFIFVKEEADTHNDFSARCSLGDPVIDRIVRVEVIIIVARMVVERRYVASLLVPLAMEIVRHNCNPVQIFGERRNVVAFVDHLLAWRDSRTEQQSPRSQFVAQLFQQICKALFIRRWTFVAVNLGQM